MNLGARLKARREALNWTQAFVASEVTRLRTDGRALTQQALHQLEKRGSEKSAFLPELALVLKTNVTWLLTGEGDPDRPDQLRSISDYARYVGDNFDRLPPIRQEMIREIFTNWGREVARYQQAGSQPKATAGEDLRSVNELEGSEIRRGD